MNSPVSDVESFFKDIKRSEENSFMTRVNKAEEIKYVIHNKDRFIAAIKDLDKILISYGLVDQNITEQLDSITDLAVAASQGLIGG